MASTSETLAPPLPLKRPNRHPLLHAFYPHVAPLTSLLPESILRPSDSHALKALVGGTVVGSMDKVVLTVEKGGGIETPMPEVVERAQARLFKLFKKEREQREKDNPGEWIAPSPPHMLTLGYRATDANTKGDSVSWSYQALPFSSWTPNTTVNFLRTSPIWQELVNRIGPSPVLTLFSSFKIAVFTPLPNDSFLQIAGTPVPDLPPRAATIREAALLSHAEEGAPQDKKKKRLRGTKTRKRGAKKKALDPVVPLIIEPGGTPPPITDEGEGRKLARTHSAPQLTSPNAKSLLEAQIHTNALRSTRSASLLPGGKRAAEERQGGGVRKKTKLEPKKPGEILLARSRLFYARPSKTMSGKVVYGLPGKHVLSRLPALFKPHVTLSDPHALSRQSRHLLKYLFPRQYGLHNVFTSLKPLWGETVDYGDREDDIEALGSTKTPKRLKELLPLMERMIRLHKKCNYRALLDRHCPSKIKHTSMSPEEKSFLIELMSEQPVTQLSKGDVSLEISDTSLILPLGGTAAEAKVRAKPKFSDYLCSAYQAQAFITAVIRQVIPRDCWGSEANAKLIIDYVCDFLTLRRFETFSLHTILQSFCVADCDWLRPKSASLARTRNDKPNAVEMEKRKELLAEFLHWFINGFVIDIARTAFCITQSAVSKHRSLFFRQDDWHSLCEPLLENLRDTMFEPVSNIEAARSSKLGFSYIRLMPKDTGVRPITNLKRRPKVTKRNGTTSLGRSINKTLGDSFQALTFEKNRNPTLVGSSVMAPIEVYDKIKSFKNNLLERHKKLPRLYLVKVDVRACYDTIQQGKLLEILDDVLQKRKYRFVSYAQAMPESGRVAKKWPTKAYDTVDSSSFPDLANDLTETLRHAILTDKVRASVENRDKLMQLVEEHITNNLVKISGSFYRQKEGVPQGSVLSGLLCGLFYGHMEQEKLRFIEESESALLRHTDDFLLVTTERSVAVKFLRVMSEGIPEYGCFISPEKRLTNFAISLDGVETIPPCVSRDFPWCGRIIDTHTLDVKVDTTRLKDSIADGLTVQYAGKPGHAFESKMMQAAKIRAEILYNDTTLNSSETVYLNIYQRLLLVALKFQTYVHEWGVDPRQNPKFFLRVIERVISFAYRTMLNRSQTKIAKRLGGKCEVHRSWVLWLGHHAFHRVLLKRCALYPVVLKSLSQRLKSPSVRNVTRRLRRVLQFPTNSFVDRPSWRR